MPLAYIIYTIEQNSAAGVSANNVRGCPKNEYLAQKRSFEDKFWGQSLSLGHYQPTYQQARKGFIYFITLRLIFIPSENHSQKKPSVDLLANARDWLKQVHLIG